jgi:hypothetical protein
MDSEEASQFKKSIKRYLEIHDEEEKVKEKVKEYKEERDNLENYILDFMERNGYQERDIIIGDYKLKYSKNKQTEGITKKWIYERLLSYFNEDEEKAKELLEHIYTERGSTTKTSLKLSKK